MIDNNQISAGQGALRASLQPGIKPAIKKEVALEPLRSCKSALAEEIRGFADCIRATPVIEVYQRDYNDLLAILSKAKPEKMGNEERAEIRLALVELRNTLPSGARLFAKEKVSQPGFCVEEQTLRKDVVPYLNNLLSKLG